jgi:hypothetical protein
VKIPKLYEYFGISVYFYAGQHLPVHVHGRYSESETVAEIITAEGKTDVYVLNKAVKPEILNRRIK